MDIRGTNPTADNIRGGLTTIEEKALGAMAKAGTPAPFERAQLRRGDRRSKGLHFMDAPAPAVENLTAFAAAGCQLIFFGTGVGNPIGNMVVADGEGLRQREHVAHDGRQHRLRRLGRFSRGARRVALVGDRLYEYAIAVASGTRTSSEVLDVRETAISRFAPTI